MATSIYLGNPPPKIKEWIEKNYKPEVDMTKVPLHFVAEQPNATMSFKIGAGTYETSPTGEEGSWTTYNSEDLITLANVGDKVYFRAGSIEGNENCFDTSSAWQHSLFDINNKKIAAKGNIQSLLDRKMEKMEVPGWCYYNIFNGCKSLTQAPELPATTLSEWCYSHMFENCESLVKTPTKLPATTLTTRCYDSMFVNCKSLIDFSLALPATITNNVQFAYCDMFYGCNLLKNGPEICVINYDYDSYCFKNMFMDCTSLAKLKFTNLTMEQFNTFKYELDMFYDIKTKLKVTCIDGIVTIAAITE